MTQEEELVQLKDQVRQFQQRESEALVARCQRAEEAADHYRNECMRLDKIARDIDATYQQELYKLRSQLESARSTQNPMRRQMPQFNGNAG